MQPDAKASGALWDAPQTSRNTPIVAATHGSCGRPIASMVGVLHSGDALSGDVGRLRLGSGAGGDCGVSGARAKTEECVATCPIRDAKPDSRM
jgi:hypothetical protein